MGKEQNFGTKLYKEVIESISLSRFMVPNQRGFVNAIGQVRAFHFKEGKDIPLVLVSTVCPPYSTDKEGKPNYCTLEDGISYNIEQHLKMIPLVVEVVERANIPVAHMFLMADTEVDLHPFLERKLGITPKEFIDRCQRSVEKVARRAFSLYGAERYQRFGLPVAERFLMFFGKDSWYSCYSLFKERLLKEAKKDPEGEVAVALKKDYQERRRLVFELLGDVSDDIGIEHIARQKAQYMAFGTLIRERFDKRVFVFNHATPNFRAMNDRRSRHLGGDQYQSEIVLFELNISSMPGDTYG